MEKVPRTAPRSTSRRVIQVVLSQRFEAHFTLPSFSLYGPFDGSIPRPSFTT